MKLGCFRSALTSDAVDGVILSCMDVRANGLSLPSSTRSGRSSFFQLPYSKTRTARQGKMDASNATSLFACLVYHCALNVCLSHLWETIFFFIELLRCIAPNMSRVEYAKCIGEETSLIAGLPNFVVVSHIIPKVVDDDCSDPRYRVMNDLRTLNKHWMHVVDNDDGWMDWRCARAEEIAIRREIEGWWSQVKAFAAAEEDSDCPYWDSSDVDEF